FGLAAGGAVYLLSGHSSPSSVAKLPGSAPTRPPDAQDAFLTGLHSTNSLPLRSDITMTETFDVSGPGGASFDPGIPPVSVTIHLDQESAQRSEMSETDSAGPGLARETVIGVLYDGTYYLSSDNGATYKTVPIDQATSHQLDPRGPLLISALPASV